MAAESCLNKPIMTTRRLLADAREHELAEETVINQEKITPAVALDICVRMVELAAMEKIKELPDYPSYSTQTRDFRRFIVPMLELARNSGVQAVDDAVVNENRASVQDESLSPEIDMYNSLEWQAPYGGLDPAVRHAMWLLYEASYPEAMQFCNDNNMLPLLAEAPLVVDFVVKQRFENTMIAGLGVLNDLRYHKDEIGRLLEDTVYYRDEPMVVG